MTDIKRLQTLQFNFSTSFFSFSASFSKSPFYILFNQFISDIFTKFPLMQAKKFSIFIYLNIFDRHKYVTNAKINFRTIFKPFLHYFWIILHKHRCLSLKKLFFKIFPHNFYCLVSESFSIIFYNIV